MKRNIYIILFLILFAACEKVIDIDLNSTDPQIVIEGVITDKPGPYTVKISQTTDYFNPSQNPMLSNAYVVISDNEGNSEVLLESEPGIYQTSTIQGVIGRTYSLSVNIDGDIFNASSYLPELTPIDSLGYDESPSPFGKNDNNYLITCYFRDVKDVENYYRVRLYKNSVLAEEINLLDDQLLDGEDIDYGNLRDEIEWNDTVTIELMNIDSELYDYYNTLNTILNDRGMTSATPSNPNSNISNGALGYFAAYSSVMDTIIIQ